MKYLVVYILKENDVIADSAGTLLLLFYCSLLIFDTLNAEATLILI